MEGQIILVNTEYRRNEKFRRYVDRYAKHNGITVVDALKHEIVKQAELYYTEV